VAPINRTESGARAGAGSAFARALQTGRARYQPVRLFRRGRAVPRPPQASKGVRRLTPERGSRRAGGHAVATHKRRVVASSAVAGNPSNAWNVNFNNGNTNNNDVGNTNQVRCVR